MDRQGPCSSPISDTFECGTDISSQFFIGSKIKRTRERIQKRKRERAGGSVRKREFEEERNGKGNEGKRAEHEPGIGKKKKKKKRIFHHFLSNSHKRKESHFSFLGNRREQNLFSSRVKKHLSTHLASFCATTKSFLFTSLFLFLSPFLILFFSPFLLAVFAPGTSSVQHRLMTQVLVLLHTKSYAMENCCEK